MAHLRKKIDAERQERIASINSFVADIQWCGARYNLPFSPNSDHDANEGLITLMSMVGGSMRNGSPIEKAISAGGEWFSTKYPALMPQWQQLIPIIIATRNDVLETDDAWMVQSVDMGYFARVRRILSGKKQWEPVE